MAALRLLANQVLKDRTCHFLLQREFHQDVFELYKSRLRTRHVTKGFDLYSPPLWICTSQSHLSNPPMARQQDAASIIC
jgi:hypothetical protein